MANWQPEMVEYIRANQVALKQSIAMGMPVALFTVHMLNLGEDETSRAARAAYTVPFHQLLSPVNEVFLRARLTTPTSCFLTA